MAQLAWCKVTRYTSLLKRFGRVTFYQCKLLPPAGHPPSWCDCPFVALRSTEKTFSESCAGFPVDDICKLVRLMDTGQSPNLFCVPQSESCPQHLDRECRKTTLHCREPTMDTGPHSGRKHRKRPLYGNSVSLVLICIYRLFSIIHGRFTWQKSSQKGKPPSGILLNIDLAKFLPTNSYENTLTVTHCTLAIGLRKVNNWHRDHWSSLARPRDYCLFSCFSYRLGTSN